MVLAKHVDAQRAGITEQWMGRSVTKQYLALVRRRARWRVGSSEITKDERRPGLVRISEKNGKPAETHGAWWNAWAWRRSCAAGR